MNNILIKVISLPSSGLRRQQMSLQLDEIGIPWQFFDALDSLSSCLIAHAGSWPIMNGRMLRESELGCYASHYELLMMHSKADEDDILIVLEDDAILDTTYFKAVDDIINLTRQFGYVKFNGQLIAQSSEVYIQGRRRVVRFHNKVHGSLAYAIDRRTAIRFCKHLKNVFRPIDIEMDRFWAHGIPVLCLYQPVAIERSAPTGIVGREFTVSGRTWLLWKINNQIEKIRCFSANLCYRVGLKRVP